jgi:type II secretion system protein J
MKRTRAAFTLLELLLAMALVSMLAATLYASLHIAFRARDSVQAASDEGRAGQLALDLMRRDLSEALPPKGILAGLFMGTDAQSDGGANADSVSFYASANTPVADHPQCDVCLVQYSLGSDENGQTALIRSTVTNLLATETPTPDTEVVCRNVMALNLRYFDGSDWLDTWDSTQHGDEPPLAVEVVLTLKPTSAPSPVPVTDQSPTDNTGYAITRVIMLPCAAAPQQNNVIMPSNNRSGGG